LTHPRCIQALTLAKAVMKLHDTPWLAEIWTTDDISFMSKDLSETIDNQTYISGSFSPSSAIAQLPSRHRLIKNGPIFALGVALLEISHGARLNTFVTAEDLDASGGRTALTDYLTANRLVENIHKRELPNFADATRRCVHCSFDGTKYDLSDDDFRERFYQGVVVPLQNDYDYAAGGA
jgi:hypothetical protein